MKKITNPLNTYDKYKCNYEHDLYEIIDIWKIYLSVFLCIKSTYLINGLYRVFYDNIQRKTIVIVTPTHTVLHLTYSTANKM